MIKVLFICYGNICRSVMAEFVLKAQLRQAGLEGLVTVDSAATSTEELGNPIYPPARRTLEAHGIPLGQHRARQIRREDYSCYDRIIGMDRGNLWDMRRAFGGDPEGKLELLSAYGAFGEEIADPYYSRDFELTYRQVQEGCAGLLKDLREKTVKNGRKE